MTKDPINKNFAHPGQSGRFIQVENRLVSVVVGSAMTTFAYDANGQRVMTVEPAGKTTYFPFPGYAEEMVGTAVFSTHLVVRHLSSETAVF